MSNFAIKCVIDNFYLLTTRYTPIVAKDILLKMLQDGVDFVDPVQTAMGYIKVAESIDPLDILGMH